jgi:hypothetical protein
MLMMTVSLWHAKGVDRRRALRELRPAKVGAGVECPPNENRAAAWTEYGKPRMCNAFRADSDSGAANREPWHTLLCGHSFLPRHAQLALMLTRERK